MHNNFFSKRIKVYLSPHLDFRVRLFNVLAMGGTIISLLMAVLGGISGVISTMIINIIVATLSFILLTVSQRTGRYQLCYIITITAIFIFFFPVLFFNAGGYHSGMPAFFVFAVVFTIFMLEGKKAIIFSFIETVLYITICIIAYFYPQTVQFLETEQDILIDIVVAFTAVSAVLGVCMLLHFKMYNDQQRQLDEQNIILSQINRAKTEFLSNTSHEMRTPLTVISVNVQTAAAILEDLVDTVKEPEVVELLQTTQSEIMRLSRMVSGMLTLASMSECVERQELDLSSLLESGSEMLRLTFSKRGNTLETQIESNLKVFGNADLLAQVLQNIMQNATTHTQDGKIILKAKRNGSEIHISVLDTGTGISSKILPRVFERGVSTGGTGFGLYLCKNVVEAHGGGIWIESEQGKGTNVQFTLPIYEGQYGGMSNASKQ